MTDALAGMYPSDPRSFWPVRHTAADAIASYFGAGDVEGRIRAYVITAR